MIDLFATMLQQNGPTVYTYPGYSENLSIWHQMSDALHLSLYRVLSLLIAVLPGILAFFLALAIFALVGKVVSWVLYRILVAFHFDARVVRSRGTGEWAPSTPPSELTARVTFWAFLLLGLVIGVSAFEASYSVGGVLSFSLLPYVTRLVGAAVLLIVGNLVARFLARSVLIGAVNAQLQYARFLSLGVKWLVLVLTAAMVLEHLEIGGGVIELAFSILFGGIVLTLALAVGLGSRGLVSRSLESHVERTEHPAPETDQAATPSETIRHF